MKIDNIGFDEVTDERIENVTKNLNWNYCEFAITPRCNFNCSYCNRFKGELSKELSFNQISKTLRILSMSTDNLRYTHYTGGEPTVRSDLSRIVKATRLYNSRVGISSNGSADIDIYKRLVDDGVELFSISLDAKSEDINSKMSGVDNIFNTVVNNIRELSKICKVTVGTVINDSNIKDIERIILFISDLGVSDIRISSATQYNKMLNIYVPESVLAKHSILKYRINNFVNNRNMRGVCGTDCKNCWMALDDISIAGNYHFPCMVYAREGGKPIGIVSDSATMKKERMEWIKNHDCTKDAICEKYCMDFKVDYNNKFSKINKHIGEFLQ